MSRFFFLHGARLRRGAYDPIPASTKLQCLRNGQSAVATPMASGASKEDDGKGRASPASLPKILEAKLGKCWLRRCCLLVS